MKRVAAIATAAAGLLMFGGMAFAETGTFWLENTGVRFNGPNGSNADWKLWANGNGPAYQDCCGGLQYQGYLRDIEPDGNNVFSHAKVAGYGYATKIYNNGGNGTKKWVDQYVWDPQATRVDDGRIEACQDRGTLFSDLCDDRYVQR